ncbi:SDR family NAD(P)-dependent oxidoreductase [uncultured Abyssibacter sp.]|uniref:SDR family NAD(P)-dependent oxidoreductase n=1 Tax=uncultured Abyssibacter sp. TaxID=2320202 RepID=UPI0032B0FA60
MNSNVVVITGALGALGRVVATNAVAAGATVVAIDVVDGTPVDGVSELVTVDLGDAEATAQALAGIAERYGRIDALVNIAGGFVWESVADGSIDTWERMFRMNVRTAVNACKGALPHLTDNGGRIVNIGAAGAAKADMGMGAYAASKAGVAKLTESLAVELKKRSITVNAVLPSIIDTPANRADMPKSDFSAWVTPQDLANVILFLLGDGASAVTGALIPVTGKL